ncbi:alpha/beta fold hydrolase [Flammeovirga yaeyamensis]|uniref:Alpha/beta fold hydrolase n=1 Tax=Flammeovirga yaeyamensis TaxID=367791 RepID=A0AAX1NB66_9BACT|nr:MULTISPECIES: alpha/beta fold hydrolase [Flammeovirga]ANQ49232.1 alpha/beta fold hydrolase [Flammeovirga sp. MY04]MBB3697905.1 RraA family protein [Flammeovirga yaeyamensis]NMF35740.1 alpha/beta fold hydrolase [Flammeovirga yaeyamensis]QWG03307.1 alpha/beta fold hydrolase [Flammeovirga yaeyamensis]
MAIDVFEKYTNEQSKFLEIDGMKVHYRIEGEGFPLVLLHGTFASLHTWDRWTEILSKKYKVIRLDIPGFGLTGPRPDRSYSVEIYLKFFETFFKQLDLKKFYIAGSSLGGWLAWEYAFRFKQQVRRLILLDAAGFNDRDSIPLLFKLVQNPILKEFKMFHGVAEYLSTPKTIIEFFLKNAYGNSKRIEPTTTTRYHEMFSRKGNKEAFLNIATSSNVDHSDHLKDLETPTLILWGEKDRWIPLANAYKFDFNLPNSSLIIYEGVGHVPMEEIPDRSAQDVIHFLENQSLDSGAKIKTSNLCDRHPKEVTIGRPFYLESISQKKSFHGQVVCFKTNNPAMILERIEEENGKGRVLVVDWESELPDALIDDDLAFALLHQEWEGIVSNANFRHKETISKLRVGIVGKHPYPKKATLNDDPIEIHYHAEVAGIEFVDGDFVYVDEDGIVASKKNLIEWEK